MGSNDPTPSPPFCRKCLDDGVITCPDCGDELPKEICERCWDVGEINCPGCLLPGQSERIEQPLAVGTALVNIFST